MPTGSKKQKKKATANKKEDSGAREELSKIGPNKPIERNRTQ